jgi:large subunit ribosomal protein L4
MAKIEVYDLERKKVGELELAQDVFHAPINEALLYEVVKAQLASRRSGTAKAKNRAEVAGSTRKIYKQKGTGRARHGGIRAPVFVGGGKAHGPLPRDYSYRPPRKMRQGAVRSALSLKVKEGKLTIVDSFDLKEVKTKMLNQVLDKLKVGTSSLIVDGKDNSKLRLSTRNLAKHHFLPPEGVNLYDLLRHEHLVLTKQAVEALQNRYKSE